MRFELALIVGILFFCSWCAYIVARMNSSVNVGTSATAGAGASSSLSPLASLNAQGDFSTGVGAGAGDLSRTVNGSSGGARSLIGHANAQQQPTRLFEASEPIPSAQFAPTHGTYSAGAGRNWPPYASSGVDSAAAGNYPAHAAAGSVAQQQQQPLNGLQQWQSYALPSHAHAGAPAPASQPLLLEYNNSEQPEAAAAAAAASEDEEGEGPEAEGGVADYPQTAAASDEEPVEGEEEEEEQTESPPPETELEEIANRRSFDELQSDSSERDKDGRVVVTKRRHLINGRPVPVKRSQRRRWNVDDSNQDREGQADDEHERAAASSRVQRELAAGRSEADFEKLVEEIDEEDKLRKKSGPKLEAVPGTGTPAVAQSFELGAGPETTTTTTTIGRRSDPDTPPREPPPRAGNAPVSVSGNSTSPAELTRPAKNKAKDSHEHSLQESLTAQQWDDDSATSGAAVAGETAPEIADNDEDQERVANIVERDREAQRLAQMSRDLLLSPERVSRELDQDDSGNDQEEEEREERRRRRRKRDTVIRSSVPFANLSLRNPSAAPALESAATSDMTSAGPRAPAAEDLSSEWIDTGAPRADERQTGSEVGASLVGGAGVGANKPDGGQKQVLFFPNLTSSSATAETHAQQNYLLKENDTMARHLIPAANSTQDHNHHHGPLFSLAPDKGRNHLRAQADNSSEHTHLSGLEDMHIEVLADPPPPAAQVGLALGATPTTGAPLSGHAHLGNPQLASESHKVKKESKVLKGKKKKKKKKFKKASKSKMVDAKYKVARAYARKHASRNKQGQTRKRRRKSEKDLVAQRKRFKGATRGNKFARGQGAHGAKKGANLFKDKGYKKRGFKKAYHKLETGDHKTYFDEFRDKDHHKKWKNFDDRHKYAQRKHWAGSDSKHLDRHKLKLAKARAHKAGKWRESATNKHTNELDKYKKYKKSSSKSKAVKSSASKKKKKKKKKAE